MGISIIGRLLKIAWSMGISIKVGSKDLAAIPQIVRNTDLSLPIKINRPAGVPDLGRRGLDLIPMAEVKLLGFWASPFSDRVIWALKLKGVKYEYVEEDPYNKSQLVLQHNPVHKKVPVLIHAGKSVPESSIILEYIEETWPQNPLLPQGAYQRATARFWIKFGEEKFATICTVLRTAGAEQERAIKEATELLKILGEQGLGDKKFFGGDGIGLVDIAFGWLAYLFGVIEEAAGVKVLDANRLPRLHAWIENLKEVPVIKDNLPDRQKLLGHLKRRRETLLALPNCNN